MANEQKKFPISVKLLTGELIQLESTGNRHEMLRDLRSGYTDLDWDLSEFLVETEEGFSPLGEEISEEMRICVVFKVNKILRHFEERSGSMDDPHVFDLREYSCDKKKELVDFVRKREKEVSNVEFYRYVLPLSASPLFVWGMLYDAHPNKNVHCLIQSIQMIDDGKVTDQEEKRDLCRGIFGDVYHYTGGSMTKFTTSWKIHVISANGKEEFFQTKA